MGIGPKAAVEERVFWVLGLVEKRGKLKISLFGA